MAMIPCPECKLYISDKAEFCVHCGLPKPGLYLKSYIAPKLSVIETVKINIDDYTKKK